MTQRQVNKYGDFLQFRETHHWDLKIQPWKWLLKLGKVRIGGNLVEEEQFGTQLSTTQTLIISI